jgi:hypothetical protein
MSTEKFTAVENDVAGLRTAIRNQSEQLNQSLSLLGQVRQELDLEKSRVETLGLQMKEVYKYLNEHRIP